MGRRKVRSQLDAIDQINITPLMDLMCMLMVVFMITAPLLENGVDVTPPTMNAEEIDTDKLIKNLTINRDGVLTYENTRVTPRELLETLRTLQQRSPDAVLLLRADGSRSYNEVIEVMRTIRESGFRNVQLVTLSEATNKPLSRK
ncbi:Biopolymer transport protein ExbD [bioreactor metagenome]|uniref:Biopolymer transport protein ExbD n=1 Tax=bioreactor metagenome TaxID=1076179 RepID=A0A645EN66_9ZZZZ